MKGFQMMEEKLKNSEIESVESSSAMNVLLLNLPHKTRIMRRYMCSYNAPDFLFPPQELIAIAGVLRSLPNVEVKLLDAIAEGVSEKYVEKVVRGQNVVICLCGFECFEDDMNTVGRLKAASPGTIFVLFGHYATEFPKDILSNTKGVSPPDWQERGLSPFGDCPRSAICGAAMLVIDPAPRR